MSQLYKVAFAIALMAILATTTSSQEKSNPSNSSRHLAGFMLGYGDQNMSLAVLDVNYDYRIILLQAQYHYILLPKKTWDLHVVVQPQYNLTEFKPVNSIDHKIIGSEFGLNVGIQIRKTIFKDFLSCYFLVSSGPHFVSGAPTRQSEGFIFSDNFFLGTNIKLKESLLLNMRFGYRHISNLELKQPNGGVNNFICDVGLLFRLKKKADK
jgi:hypothetical protein